MELKRNAPGWRSWCTACEADEEAVHFEQEPIYVTELPRPHAQAIDCTFENEFRLQ